MESYNNNRLIRKFFNCTKCKEYDAKLVNPFSNHIYCSKCGSLLNEIPEAKYKKLKKKININKKEDIKESNNKIPYKINDNVMKKNYINKDNYKKDKKDKPKESKHHHNKNRYQSSSHYSNNNNINNNNYNNNHNNINNIRINIDNNEDIYDNINNNINNHNINININNNHVNRGNNINNEQQRHHHQQQQSHQRHRRGRSINPHNSNNFFANFFQDVGFDPFSEFDFGFDFDDNRNINHININNNINYNSRRSPFRITVHRDPISNDIFDPIFSSFGSMFDNIFQDNFSSNFRSNLQGDFISQILSILQRNQEEANRNKHPPASDTALKKLKKFNMNEKYCKKDKNGKIELPNCCICLTEIQKGENTVLLPCGHMFHWKCCLTWLKKNNTCPMCRFEIK